MSTNREFRGRVIFVLLLATALGLGLTVLWIGRVIFLLLFAAVIGAVLLTAVAEYLGARMRIRTGLALGLFLAAVTLLVGVAIWAQGPNFAVQFQQLGTQLPAAARQLLMELRYHSWGLWLLKQTPDPDQVSKGLSYAFSQIGGIVVSSATVLAGLVIVLSLSLYFAIEPGAYYGGLKRLVPSQHREKLDKCATSVAQILRWWVLAKLISMSMVGVLISLGLAMVGVPLAGSLGLIAGCLTFIPNVGPLIAALPALLLALAISPMTGLLTVGVFAVVFALEGYLVTPMLERKIVRLPPALTLTMQLVLAAIAGPVGVALAAPIAAAGLGVLKVLIPEDGVEAE
jgi:predicted PurR-regulated permease PerM